LNFENNFVSNNIRRLNNSQKELTKEEYLNASRSFVPEEKNKIETQSVYSLTSRVKNI